MRHRVVAVAFGEWKAWGLGDVVDQLGLRCYLRTWWTWVRVSVSSMIALSREGGMSEVEAARIPPSLARLHSRASF